MEVKDKWELAIDDEIVSLMENQTWNLIELLESKQALHNKWFYRLKEEHDGIKRYKARLVMKGFQQGEGIDIIEIFSFVVKLTMIRSVLSVTTEDLRLNQLDVKIVFLHGDLEDIFMMQPQGYVMPGKEHLVYKLKKSLYDLKHALRQ